MLCFTGSAPKATYARKKQKTIEEDFEDEAEIMPQTKTARQINLETPNVTEEFTHCPCDGEKLGFT